MHRIAFAALLAFATGCASAHQAGDPRPIPPLLADLAPKPAASPNATPRVVTGRGPLSLVDAQRLALAQNPALAARSTAVQARVGEAKQARAIPNPELELTAEDLVVGGAGGGGGGGGVDAQPVQLTAALTQPIELGGKRGARIAAAQHRRVEAELELERERLRVYRETSKAFIDLLAAQRRDANAGEMVVLAEETMRVLTAKAEAGRTPDLEIKRTRVALALARIERRKAAQARDAARLALATLIGQSEPQFERARGGFAIPDKLPDLAELLPRVEHHPELRRCHTVIAKKRTELDAARADAIPDVSVGLGYRYLKDGARSALLATLAIPVPLWDRNQGRVDAAGHEIAGAQHEAEAAELELTRELKQTVRDLHAAHFEVQSLSREVVAEARESYGTIVDGYRLGRFGYLDLLDAQRTLFAAVQQAVEARALFFKAAIDMEGLVGQSLFDWTADGEQTDNDLGIRQALEHPRNAAFEPAEPATKSESTP
ncbi:MAG: TolC family protein [Deltaproteobacteria bacterium]|nr:TolC family protein [Deltaproteobacteria bacterium]